MRFLTSLFSGVPKAKPIDWRTAIAQTDKWVGSAGGRWSGFDLFAITREDFVETGETYCLDSKISGCFSCFPTLELAQQRAQEQLQELLQIAA